MKLFVNISVYESASDNNYRSISGARVDGELIKRFRVGEKLALNAIAGRKEKINAPWMWASWKDREQPERTLLDNKLTAGFRLDLLMPQFSCQL